MKLAKLTFALVLVCLMAGTVLAQDSSAPRRGRGPGAGGPGGQGVAGSMFDRYVDIIENKLDLTADQKTKVEALKSEYAPKFKALREKSEKILTDDQKKALETALKSAREAKPEERRDAFRKAMESAKLTDDQKKQREEVGQESRKLFEELRPKVAEILTDEQKTKLREAMGTMGGGRRGGHGPGGSSGEKSKRST